MTAQTHDPDRLYWDDHVRDGIEAREQRDGAQWRLGDLAVEVETTYDEQSLQKYAEEIGVGYRTLLDYRWVAKKFQSSERSENLSWGHHQAVAALDDPEPWLRMAAAGDGKGKPWSAA